MFPVCAFTVIKAKERNHLLKNLFTPLEIRLLWIRPFPKCAFGKRLHNQDTVSTSSTAQGLRNFQWKSHKINDHISIYKPKISKYSVTCSCWVIFWSSVCLPALRRPHRETKTSDSRRLWEIWGRKTCFPRQCHEEALWKPPPNKLSVCMLTLLGTSAVNCWIPSVWDKLTVWASVQTWSLSTQLHSESVFL